MIKNLEIIFDEILRDSFIIPNWIDPKRKDDKLVYDITGSLISELTYLMKEHFIDDKMLFKFTLNYYNMVIQMDSIKDISLYLRSWMYINDLINKYIDMAVNLEEFEIASNLTRFKKTKDEFENYDNSGEDYTKCIG